MGQSLCSNAQVTAFFSSENTCRVYPLLHIAYAKGSRKMDIWGRQKLFLPFSDIRDVVTHDNVFRIVP